MLPFTAVKLMRKYEKCRECGSDLIGKGEGTLEINEDTFKRTCKCGWRARIRVNEKEVLIGYYRDLKTAEIAINEARMKHYQILTRKG